MIELKNVSKFYNNKNTVSLGLKNINLKFNTNEIVAITGESGSGKSTLLKVISKIDKFDEGEIYYFGEETSYFDTTDMDNFRKNKVGFIFQEYNIIDSYTVLRNVMIPLEIAGLSDKEAKEKATELIKKVGLINRIKNRGTQLSGGEKQRCVIARALASDCSIFACDEPTGNLDSNTGKEIIKLIKEVAKDKLVLIVTHNYEEVKDFVTRKIVLKDGEVYSDDIFKKIKEEKKNALFEENKILKRKQCLKFASNNLRFTPKKTIFISLVVALFSLFILFAVADFELEINSYTKETSFLQKYDDSVYVCNDSNDSLDEDSLSNISSDIVYDPYEAFNTTRFYTSDDNGFAFSYEDPSDISSIDLDYGTFPTSDDEVLMFINKDEATYSYDDFLNKKISDITQDPTDPDVYWTIVGIAYSDDVDCYTLFDSQTLKDFVHYEQYQADISFSDKDGEDYNAVNFDVYYSDSMDNEIILPTEYETENVNVSSIEFTYDDYEYTTDTEFSIVYSDNLDYVVYVNSNFSLNEVYEALIYGDTSSIISQAEDLGYYAIKVTDYESSSSTLENTDVYASLVEIVFILIVLFFITYLILKIIFKSKIKDYNIFRTLGVTKGSMRKIVSYELLILMTILSTIIFILFYFVGQFGENHTSSSALLEFFELTDYLNFGVYIVYLIIMIILGLLISLRLNKKLFKYSVNEVFNEGDKND